MVCSCGIETETRSSEDGFIHGCWKHEEALDITDECFNTLETIFDTIPRTGIYHGTEAKAIESWNEWNEAFKQSEITI